MAGHGDGDPGAVPADPPGPRPRTGRSLSGSRRAAAAAAQQQELERRLREQMDREDCRIKELTEAILYDFLPAAFHALLDGGGGGGSAAAAPEQPQQASGTAEAATADAAAGGTEDPLARLDPCTCKVRRSAVCRSSTTACMVAVARHTANFKALLEEGCK